MKVQLFSLFCLLLGSVSIAAAQNLKSEEIPVSGNCGMCKSKIEKAAQAAGVSSADWNRNTKVLTVKYNPKATNTAKIQQSVADAGYDTRDVRAADSVYQNLHSCCKYERTKTYTNISTKNKGGDDHQDCCLKTDQKCKDTKGTQKATGKPVDCKKNGIAKDCCIKS